MNSDAEFSAVDASTSREPSPANALPSVAILIPAYGSAAQLQNCLASLAGFAPERCSLHVLDDATPDPTVREVCEQIAALLPKLHYVRSDVRRGFAGACNWGCNVVGDKKTDILLLHADTEVTAGFLDEMQAVLHRHERHGVVAPRSNDAGLFSFPVDDKVLSTTDSSGLWEQVSRSLARHQVMPSVADFCMLVKGEILDRFGLFDEAYASSLYAADDFVCRINRFGYSAVAANWAYVFHYRTLLPKPLPAVIRECDRDTLLYRYPEYERRIANYLSLNRDPVERFVALNRPHRPRILYDLFHLTPAHTGTSDFGLNLLRELSRIVADEFDLSVGIYQPERFFAHELAGFRIYEDRQDPSPVFDLIFKPCQVISWTEFRRMAGLAPRLSCTVLDIIGVRCEYLNSPSRQIVLQRSAELSDCVFTLSDFARSDYAAFYGEEIPFQTIHLGTNSGITDGEFRRGNHILVMGNNFAHKGVRDAIDHLSGEFPVIVLGGEPEPVPSNFQWLPSGRISRQHMRELLSNSRLLVYPSYYEGFGLPVVDALALGKPVVAMDSATNRELASALANSNLHLIGSMKDLASTVAGLFDKEFCPPGKEPRRWSDVARDYAQKIREILSREFDPVKVRARWELLRTLDATDRKE